MPELPDRPAPPRSVAERIRAWLQWVGAGRVAAASLAIVAVVAAAYWLVKPPAATTESRLPYAPRGSTTPSASSLASTSGVTIAAPSTTTGDVAVAVDVVVDVAGAVVLRGVYHLRPGSRVQDAVKAAGGLAADANSDAVNLAAPVTDGQRVYVPHLGEVAPPVGEPGSPTSAPGPVNINTATAEQLDRLPGVGPATSAAIIAHRTRYGPFTSVDGLADVRGIGPAKVAALRGLVTV